MCCPIFSVDTILTNKNCFSATNVKSFLHFKQDKEEVFFLKKLRLEAS